MVGNKRRNTIECNLLTVPSIQGNFSSFIRVSKTKVIRIVIWILFHQQKNHSESPPKKYKFPKWDFHSQNEFHTFSEPFEV